jgi:hypothetical protein
MRRIAATATALLLVLTFLAACDDTIIGFGPEDGPLYISIIVGMTAGEVLDPGEQVEIGQIVAEKWAEQNAENRLEDSRFKAEKIAEIMPDLIDISISNISLDGENPLRPSLRDDGCGGYIATMLDALDQAGLEYRIQGETTACEESFVILMPDGRQALASVTVMEYYLRLILPEEEEAQDRDTGATPNPEPRHDPPTYREKRVGGEPRE